MTEIVRISVDLLVWYLKTMKSAVLYASTAAYLIVPSAVLLATAYAIAHLVARILIAFKKRLAAPSGAASPPDDQSGIEKHVCC